MYENRSKGITLVALVITIIILLILSTISIQALTHTGLFASVNKAKLETKRSQIAEWLGLRLLEEQMKNPSGTAEEIITETRNSVIENKNELLNMGKEVNIEDTSIEEDGEQVDIYFYVIVDKDVYKVDMVGARFIGEQGKMLPVIKLESLTSTTNSIKIKVRTSRNQGGKLEYYIKAEEDKNYTLKQTKEDDSEYIFEELEQNKKYNIKVIAKAENGQQAELTVEKTTGNVTELKQGDVEFIYSVDGIVIDKSTWTNKNVTVTAKINSNVDIGTFKIQTSNGGENWKDGISQLFTENGTMYVILTDGINYGGAATVNVTNIDTTKPVVTEATATTNSIKIIATDEASGIVGYAITTSNTSPTDASYTKIANTKTFETTVTGKTEGTTYYIWVKDQAGNISNAKQITTLKQEWKDISKNNYGDYVNYPIDLNKDGNTTNDWKIFYKDNNGYVYLIANNNQNLYTDILTLAGMQESTQNKYCVYWKNIPQYNEITDFVKTRYKMGWNKSKTNPNIKSVSQLLNTNNWKNLVNTNYAIDAIGAPTVEMWVESWNEKGYKKLYYNNNGDTGYCVGDVEAPTTMHIEGLSTEDTLYFPDYLAYWLASPAAGHTGNLLCINNPGISYAYFQFDYWTIRPVVCLKNDISGERINNIWQFK
jgi:hypothetical protein